MKQNYFASIIMVAVFMLAINAGYAQDSKTISPSKTVQAVFVDVSPPIRDIIMFGSKKTIVDNKEIKNKFELDRLIRNSEEFTSDPVVQNYINYSRDMGPTVEQVFPGASNSDNLAVLGIMVAPPDTEGDVGPNHYVQMVNLVTTIFDKDGNVLMGPVANNVFWSGMIIDGRDLGAENDGDPVVLYDQFEDRWIVSHFAVDANPYYELIAVSKTGDPTGEYYRYAINYGNDFPDYPKMGIWNDAIYISTRDFPDGGGFASSLVGLPKEGLYNGTGEDGEVTGIKFTIPYTTIAHDGFLPADADGPVPPADGTPHYSMFKPNVTSGSSLYIVTTTPDWDNLPNSTMTYDPITVASYLSPGSRVSQPNGITLDVLDFFLMYRLPYRNFGDHQSMMAIHSVKATSGGAYGIRWYEFRSPSPADDFTVYQQGTFLPADGENRWMGSIAMNGNGDIALGYSVTSATTHPSIRFVGQSAGAPGGLGVMDLAETSIHAGSYSQGTSSLHRWGDYSMMTVDPSDDESFWFTTENASAAGGWGNWETKIAELKLNAVQADPAIIAVTPASLTFDVLVDGSDDALLNIANTGIEGASDLNWSLSFVEPVPVATNISAGDGLNNEINLTNNTDEFYDKTADEILTIKYAMAEDDRNRSETPSPMRAGGPDAFGYTFIDSDEAGGPVFDWTDISGTGTAVTLGDDNSVLVTLPFSFPFYGNPKTEITIASNGYLTFGTTGNDFSNDPIPSASTPNDIICPFWDDLNPGAGGTVHYLSLSNQFIVQFTNVPRFSAGSLLTFQVVLYDNGSILFQYYDMQGTLNSATIGIEDATASSGLQVAYNEAYIHDDLAAQITPPAPPCPWLSVSPLSGTIAQGTSQDVTVLVDAIGLALGTYECQLTFSSNASNSPEVVVPVTLNVIETSSAVVLPFLEDWETENGTVTNTGNIYTGTGYDWSFETEIPDRGRARFGTDTYQANNGNGALTLDKQPSSALNGDNIPCANNAILTLDLSNYLNSTGLEFSFWWTDHSDEEHPGDKVWIRGNSGDEWVVVYDLNPKKSQNNLYHFVGPIDIDNILASASPAQTVSSTFQLRFGQEDNTQTPWDGISFDDILIEEISNTPVTLPFTEDWETETGVRQTDGLLYSGTSYNWNFETNSPNEGRTRWGTESVQAHSGIGALTMDKYPGNYIDGANKTILTLDLSNYTLSTDLELSFWWADHSDEEHPGDKVWIRGSDSDTWLEAYDLNPKQNTSNVYHLVGGLDIDNILASAIPAQTVSSTFQVSFGQEDNTNTPFDGISFDDITIQEIVLPPVQSQMLAGIGDNQRNDFNLKNYPNPFKGTTTIQFTLENSNYTKLTVYNSLGVEVAALFDGQAEGKHVYQLEFNSMDLPSGIYFYHLQTSDGVNTVKKMQLIK